MLTEVHLLFECKELIHIREDQGLVDFAKNHGGTKEEVYGDYWRMRDCEDKERTRRVNKAMRVRKEFWNRMGVEDTQEL